MSWVRATLESLTTSAGLFGWRFNRHIHHMVPAGIATVIKAQRSEGSAKNRTMVTSPIAAQKPNFIACVSNRFCMEPTSFRGV
jgi:hypothetical protein